MKITKSYLKRLIKEEISNLAEDPFDDMDRELGKRREVPGTEKKDCAQQPADGREAKAMAIAGLNAIEGLDGFEEMDALRAHCISGTKKGNSGGEGATQVTFKNRARIVVLDSELGQP